MSCTVVYSLLRITGSHEAIYEAGCEGVAAADTIHDLEALVIRCLVYLAVCPAECGPVVYGCSVNGTKRRCNCLEVRVGLYSLVDHLLVAVDIELLQRLVLALDLEAEASGEVFLVTDHNVNVLSNLLIYLLRLCLAADCGPHGRTVVEVIGNDGAILLRSLDRSDCGLGSLLRKSCIDSAGVEPANAELTEDVIEIKISRCSLGNSGVGTVGAALCTTDTEASLCEVQSVSAYTADSVGVHPLYEGCIHTTLHHEVLNQVTDLIVCKCSKNSGL